MKPANKELEELFLKDKKKREKNVELMFLIAERLKELIPDENFDRRLVLQSLDRFQRDPSLNVDWEKLLNFDDANFMHDLAGILNQVEGFLPRCAEAK